MKPILLSPDSLLLAQAVLATVARQVRASTNRARFRYGLAVREADSYYPGNANLPRRRAHYAPAGQALRQAVVAANATLRSLESVRRLTQSPLRLDKTTAQANLTFCPNCL